MPTLSHPFLPFLIAAEGSVRQALASSSSVYPQWTFTWYLQQMLEDTAFAQQVEKIQAQALVEKAIEVAPHHPGIHQILLKAFRPERFALSGSEQLSQRALSPQEWEAFDLQMNGPRD